MYEGVGTAAALYLVRGMVMDVGEGSASNWKVIQCGMVRYGVGEHGLYMFAKMILSAVSRHYRLLPTTLDGRERLPFVSGASVQSP